MMSIPYIGPVLRVVKAAWDLVLGAIADAFEWLSRRGNKLRLICGVLAIGLSYKAFESYDRGQQMVVVRAACAALA